MYVKSLVLDGFKSYGHRTLISGFDQEFNAITGLNGSGKSNILDAICFVLGITNLSHVRAANLQDLIYKSGQCGVSKASVSITFDNRNVAQAPAGFENIPEITITRQVVIGGKNKYMINGTTVPNKKIQDLFCSVQLNVNNPHFLIMQGKITKVLNMRPAEILGMIEEAAGTKMYEVKKKFTESTIQKKEQKLTALAAILKEELEPKLEKLRAERERYMEYRRVERDLENSLKLYEAWEYFASKRRATQAQQLVSDLENEIAGIVSTIEESQVKIQEIDEEVSEISKKSKTAGNEKLAEAEQELKAAEKEFASTRAKVKSLKDNIKGEEDRKKQLETNLQDDKESLESKRSALEQVQNMFETLKQTSGADESALAMAQKRLEALSLGMDLNEQGEQQTLLEQLRVAQQEAATCVTDVTNSRMQIDFVRQQLSEKERRRSSSVNELRAEEQNLELARAEVANLESGLKKLNFDERQFGELRTRHGQLQTQTRQLRSKCDQFDASRPWTRFNYRDPEPGFDRRKVLGVVCRLFEVTNDWAARALETIAGGRLYNVVIDSDVTGKKLLQRGQLQSRTTFIPLNKIQAHKMGDNVIQFAQQLVGEENCQPAMAHVKYDSKIRVVMDYVFGNAFVCKDLNVAKKVAFHPKVKRRCITLDGDVVDPAGSLSGGAPSRDASILKQLQDIRPVEDQLKSYEAELAQVEQQLNQLSPREQKYRELQQRLELQKHEVAGIEQRIQKTGHFQQQTEIAELKKQLESLQQKIEECQDKEKKCNAKVKDLQVKIGNQGNKDKQMKEAEGDVHKAQLKSEKSKKEWKKREQEYETFKLEIVELEKSLVVTEQQIRDVEEAIVALKAQLEEISANHDQLNEKVTQHQSNVSKQKSAIAAKNQDVQRKMSQKDQLQSEIAKMERQLKELGHSLKSRKDECKTLKAKQQDCEKNRKADPHYLKQAEKMSEEDGRTLDAKIRSDKDQKNRLSRTVNAKVQEQFEHEEKQYLDAKKKQRIVEHDKRKLLETIAVLDRKKEVTLTNAYEQISKDFGSIFGTLLPGANAKLLPPTGQTILQGLEVKVSLGGVWKESLTELSGGQRSLAALSLILAMLLFKPAPLYILDEVDAALDLSHTQNIGNMLKSHFKKSQFIIVSLKDGMFNNANVLFKTQFVDGVSTVTRTNNK